MRFLKRWFFWIFSTVGIVAAIVFGGMVFMQYSELAGNYKKLMRNQKAVKRYSTQKLASKKVIKSVEALLEEYRSDIKRLIENNRKFERTNFELFFSEPRLTTDLNSIDLNKYRSIYETERDKVLASAKRDGAFALPGKGKTGFQFFGNDSLLSRDALPVIQKRFWITQAVYQSFIEYNKNPLVIDGWEFVEDKGDVKKRREARITEVVQIRHRKVFAPPDLTSDDSGYLNTREVMKAFYFFDRLNLDVELIVPAEAVSAILRVLVRNPLLFGVRNIEVTRLENFSPDRYATPLSTVKLGLIVLDFNEELFEEKKEGEEDEFVDAYGERQ